MDVSVILTYRCNSKCSMCYVWQNPTHPDSEVTLETLRKLPEGIDYLNLTGGEPTLRKDLVEIVDVLHPKTNKLEISTNGLLSAPLEQIVRKHPDVKIRVSVEGVEDVSNRIRGEKDGFRKKMETMDRLTALGGCDLGFAITIQDDNVDQLVDVYRLAGRYNVELATSALHNGFQFHKTDNAPYDRVAVAKSIEPLITEMLRSRRVKNWFRAYLNLGLISKVLGRPRLMPCTAGRDFAFVDPWGDVYACNVRPDTRMGNLAGQSWDEIYHGPLADELRARVGQCKQNCWMVASAKTAMRNRLFPRLPRLQPLAWVLVNRARVLAGRPIPFDRYVDYGSASGKRPGPRRGSFLEQPFDRRMHGEPDDHYKDFRDAFNG